MLVTGHSLTPAFSRLSSIVELGVRCVRESLYSSAVSSLAGCRVEGGWHLARRILNTVESRRRRISISLRGCLVSSREEFESQLKFGSYLVALTIW